MGDLTRYDSNIADAVAQYPAVPEAWVRAVIGAETSYNDPPVTFEPKVNEYSYGPMQVLLSTAQGLGFNVSADQLQDPETNILVGTALINSLLDRAGGSFEAMYSAYNSGSTTAYQTSSQVASNVQRAVGWLSSVAGYVSQAAGAAADTLAAGTDQSGGLVAVLILALLYLAYRGK